MLVGGTTLHALTPPLAVRTEGKEARKAIVWSYSVQWEQSDVAWASRWDTYLSTDDPEIHWFSIINSLVTVLFLSGERGARGQLP